MLFSKKAISAFLLILAILTSGFALDDKAQKTGKKKKKQESVIRPHEEIVVTATMTQKAVKDCTASVSVIEWNDLKAIAASNAMNLLSYLPGIFIHRTGDFGRADVNIRGIGQRGRRIAILVDGRPEKMGLFGCGVTHAFPLDNVDRIEVVRGPHSVLYGSEAIGGVVNILTRMPEKKFETDITAFYGSFNTKQINFSHGGNLKRFSYFFTLDRRSSDGHRENTQYTGNSFTGKVKYDLADNLQISFQGKYFEGKKYEAGSIDVPLSDFWNDYERGAVDFSLSGKAKRDDFVLKIYRNFGHHRFSDGWHSRDYINGGVIRYTTREISNNELTFGVDFRKIGGKSYNWPKGAWDKSEAAVFFQNEYVLLKRWILSAGLRLHRDSLYGNEICPHGGIVFQANETTSLRALINKGFRSPQLNELYMYPAANPDLEPERIWNYELGFSKDVSNWLTLDGSVFRMEGSNLIESSLNDSPPPSFMLLNIGEFSFKGAELGLRARFNSNISAHLFYTYLDPGEKTRGRPGQKMDFGFRIKQKFLFASLQAQYIMDYFADDFSARPLSSYFLLSSRLSIEISPTVELMLDVNNIFNTKYNIYVDLPGVAAGIYPMPGCNLNIGLRIKQ